MNQRFQNAEISLVREKYKNDELYAAIRPIGLRLEAEMNVFRLCPEECFMEVRELLHDIASKGEDFVAEIEDTWLFKHNEYRRFAGKADKADKDEFCKAVGIVFGFVILAVDSCSHPFYRRRLPGLLLDTVAAHAFKGWQHTLDRIFSVPLRDGWFDDFMDGEADDDGGMPMLPATIDNSRTREYFRKAIKKGWMKAEGQGFVWRGFGKTGHTTQLAYFCGRIFGYVHSINGNHGTTFPEEELNKLFGVKRLYTSLTQAHDAKNRQKWRDNIDELFE